MACHTVLACCPPTNKQEPRHPHLMLAQHTLAPFLPTCRCLVGPAEICNSHAKLSAADLVHNGRAASHAMGSLTWARSRSLVDYFHSCWLVGRPRLRSAAGAPSAGAVHDHCPASLTTGMLINAIVPVPFGYAWLITRPLLVCARSLSAFESSGHRLACPQSAYSCLYGSRHAEPGARASGGPAVARQCDSSAGGPVPSRFKRSARTDVFTSSAIGALTFPKIQVLPLPRPLPRP